jgi:hypothetical protein
MLLLQDRIVEVTRPPALPGQIHPSLMMGMVVMAGTRVSSGSFLWVSPLGLRNEVVCGILPPSEVPKRESWIEGESLCD